MQRKPRTESKTQVEKMPTQAPLLRLTTIEQAKLALPIFGGTSPDPDNEQQQNNQQQSGGGSDPKPAEQMSPDEIQKLVNSVTELTGKVTQLQTENDGYKQAEDKKKRESQSREDTLSQDLDKAQQTIAQMDGVIKYVATVNAILNNESGISFHDPADIVSKLDFDAFELEVDLESNRAGVKGIENELKRVAKEKPWLVKTGSQEQSQEQQQPAPPKSSGKPPANNGGQGGNKGSQQRAAMETKWPILAQGRVKMPKLTR